MTQNDLKLLTFIDYETLMDNARAFANAIGISIRNIIINITFMIDGLTLKH